MSKLFILASFTLLLTACANGNDSPVANSYGYNQNVYSPVQNGLCPPRVAMDWNNFVAALCNQSQDFGGACARGVELFLQNDQFYLQGPGCALVTDQVAWCPADWRGQQSFRVNIPVLQSILTQRGGPEAYPTNGGGFVRPH